MGNLKPIGSCNLRLIYILTSLLFQRRQFGLNCKKNIAMKITYKIVALFTENYPSAILISHLNYFLKITNENFFRNDFINETKLYTTIIMRRKQINFLSIFTLVNHLTCEKESVSYQMIYVTLDLWKVLLFSLLTIQD